MAPCFRCLSNERETGAALDAQLVSFTLPLAFTASELNLLTLVVQKPGNQTLCSGTHTEGGIKKKRSSVEIFFSLYMMYNDLLSFLFL